MSATISASSFVSLTVGFTVRPPRFAFVKVTSAGRSLRRIPARCSSSARTSTWVSNTSIIRRIRSHARATDRTSFPRPRPAAAPLEAPRLLLVLEPRQLRLQPPDVVLGRLVVRRLLDLVLDRLNLFLDRHLDTGPIGRGAKRFLPEYRYQTVRMPSGSSPLTAYRTMRHERAVYGDKSRPPSTRWTNRPAASSISFSSASVYARTEAVNSRVPFRSMITWRVSNRPRSRSNDASSRTTVPSSRACQLCDGNLATRLSRLNSSIRNFPRGRSARAIPRKTSRSSSGRSKYPNDVNIEIAASKPLRYGRRRMSPWTNVGLTPAVRAALRASARSGAERSKPVTRYPRFASSIVWRPAPHATSRMRPPFRRWRILSIASTWAGVSGWT